MNVEYNKYHDIILYLNDIIKYVNSIIYYHTHPNSDLDLYEILSHLKCIESIVEEVKDYIDSLYSN